MWLQSKSPCCKRSQHFLGLAFHSGSRSHSSAKHRIMPSSIQFGSGSLDCRDNGKQPLQHIASGVERQRIIVPPGQAILVRRAGEQQAQAKDQVAVFRCKAPAVVATDAPMVISMIIAHPELSGKPLRRFMSLIHLSSVYIPSPQF